MDQESVFITEIKFDDLPVTTEKRKRYPNTALLLRSTCRSVWISLAALGCTAYMAFFAILAILFGAFDRTGSASDAGERSIDNLDTAFILFNVVVVILACIVMYRLLMAMREFRIYFGPLVAFAAAAVSFLGGQKLMPVAVAFLYIGYMIMTIGTLWVCKKAHPEEQVLKSGILAIVVLHVLAVMYLLPMLSERLEIDNEVVGFFMAAAILFQGIFYTIAASKFSKDIPKRRRRSSEKQVSETE